MKRNKTLLNRHCYIAKSNETEKKSDKTEEKVTKQNNQDITIWQQEQKVMKQNKK